MTDACDTFREPMTLAEIEAIQPHAGWSDGRAGYMWCRFDALLSPEGEDPHYLRAEVTWDDDDLDEPSVYFDPQLKLESNMNHAKPGDKHMQLETFDEVSIDLTKDEAIAMIAGDPAVILARYAEEIGKLKLPR